jgi:CheY-like chemotaxis protein
LLAEDNKINQIVGLKLLQKLGIAAELAENGEQAVRAVIENAYDVVLMDVQMPGVDGIAATREICKRLPADHRPFICGLSAHAAADFQEQCRTAGMDAYLTKPLEFDKLQKILADRSESPAAR